MCSYLPHNDRSHVALDYSVDKEVWAFQGNRIAVRFAEEWA
jgi:nuclear transport factor 2 (NTF2) superfamily protein